MSILRDFIVPAGGKAVLVLLAVGTIVVTGLHEYRSALDAAAEAARSERDAYWTAEIERQNAANARILADQLQKAVNAQASAEASEAAIRRELQERTKDNAALPNGDACGLPRSRVKLLVP